MAPASVSVPLPDLVSVALVPLPMPEAKETLFPLVLNCAALPATMAIWLETSCVAVPFHCSRPPFMVMEPPRRLLSKASVPAVSSQLPPPAAVPETTVVTVEFWLS